MPQIRAAEEVVECFSYGEAIAFTRYHAVEGKPTGAVYQDYPCSLLQVGEGSIEGYI
jgi:hypothetical protein